MNIKHEHQTSTNTNINQRQPTSRPTSLGLSASSTSRSGAAGPRDPNHEWNQPVIGMIDSGGVQGGVQDGEEDGWDGCRIVANDLRDWFAKLPISCLMVEVCWSIESGWSGYHFFSLQPLQPWKKPRCWVTFSINEFVGLCCWMLTAMYRAS